MGTSSSLQVFLFKYVTVVCKTVMFMDEVLFAEFKLLVSTIKLSFIQTRLA